MSEKMKPRQRRDFILKYIRDLETDFHGHCNIKPRVDILDEEFVDAYISFCKPPYKTTVYGAHKCEQLGRDLSSMYKDGELQRGSISLPPGSVNLGFPRWVYSYTISR